jgi:tripartite-type tricarboxylate transporter receptor subunit TctC
MILRTIVLFSLGCMASVALGQAPAPAYPSKVVRFIVPNEPGSPFDVMGRELASFLSSQWGQPAVVENRSAAGGIVAAETVIKAPPDGHVLLFTADPVICALPLLYRNLSYGTADLTGVTTIAQVRSVFMINADVPARTLKELVALAKAKPGTLNYGSSGQGTAAHLAFELFKQQAGIDLVHVPYKGLAQVTTAMIAGNVQLGLSSIIGGQTAAKSGKIRVLVLDSPARSPLLPDVPTFAESGFPQISIPAWFGVAAGAGTPKPLVERINRDIVAVVRNPAFREQALVKRAFEPVGNTPEQMAELIRETVSVWAPIIKSANIHLD